MKKIFLSAALITALFGCKKEETQGGSAQNAPISEEFDFSTDAEHTVSFSVRDLQDQALQGVRLDVFTADPAKGGKRMASFFTDQSGLAQGQLRVAKHIDQVFVRCNFVGFANSVQLAANGTISHQFGGAPAPRMGKKSTTGTLARIPAGGNVYYMGTYNSQGLPNYLEPQRDVISASFLNDIAASLPESQPVPTTNPSYLVAGNELDIVVNDSSEVWITFVGEGAGFKNSLGFYVFNTNNPPTSAAQIDSIFLVFPNASLDNSGGDLVAGDKVKLGVFPAGKTISWVLMQDAWDATSQTVNVNKPRLYSNKNFNPQSNANLRQQTVQLIDQSRQLLLNGFEDIIRPAGDEDFNDCLFYITANPWTGVTQGSKFPAVTSGPDDDGDGVPNNQDDYPNDPARACDIDFDGTLAFEDLWPSKGDYDFNDLVVDYDITHVANAQNKVVEVKIDYSIQAVGAGFNNGFGFQFANLSNTAVSSVTGTSLSGNLVTTSGNGLEAGQSKATVIAWDQTFTQIQHAGGPYINTIIGDPQVTPVTKSLMVSFGTPVDANLLGVPPYNAFIFVDGDRGREVHLSNELPTDLANTGFFGTGDDNSDTQSGQTYKALNNLPWALHINGGFDYPVEKANISNAYLKFNSWASSNGSLFPDWYLDLTGYRNGSNIY